MSVIKLLTTAIRNLRYNPLRTFLTLLGMIIGVSAVIILMSLGNATTSQVSNQIQSLGSNLLVITPGQSTENGVNQGIGSANSLTNKDVTQLQKQTLLSAVSPAATTRAQIIYGSSNYQTNIEGGTSDLFSIRTYSFSAGRPFHLIEEQNEAQVAIIGATTAETFFGNMNPVGKSIQINGLTFQVIGVLATQGSNGPTNNDDRILVPYSTLTKKMTGKSTPDSIYVSAKNAEQMEQAQMAIEFILRQNHGLSNGESNDFEVTNQASILSTLNQVTQTLQTFLGGIAGISLLVGGIGIMNIMLVSVTERTKEIGLRKALGATRIDILKQFIVESCLVGLLGGVFGMIVGVIGSFVGGQLMQSEIEISITSVWLSFAVSFLIGVVFGIYPAHRAAKMSPIHALRYE